MEYLRRKAKGDLIDVDDLFKEKQQDFGMRRMPLFYLEGHACFQAALQEQIL